MNFAALGLFSVVTGSIAEPRRREILGNSSNAVLDVLAVHPEGSAFFIYTPQCDVNVREFRIVMLGGNPLQARPEVALHFSHQISREFLQIQSFAKFWRDDHLKQPLVARLLPLTKCGINREALTDWPEALMTPRRLVRGALARDVASMRFPLAGRLVR
jgi:hypothetical protein